MPVKWLSLLMSVIVIMLSVRPCCADSERDMAGLGIHGCSGTGTSDDGPCSPFYTCGNCVNSVVLKASEVPLLPRVQTLKTIYPPYTRSFPSAICLSIWQPPQLV